MKIKINGKISNIGDGASVEKALLTHNINLETVVVELNEQIIKKPDWKETFLKENDTMEIISFVGGG